MLSKREKRTKEKEELQPAVTPEQNPTAEQEAVSPAAPEQNPADDLIPDLTREVKTADQETYDFHGYFAEEEEPPSFMKAWRNIWQVILGAYGAFLPLFLTLFVALFLAFLLLRLFLLL